ncbi:cell division protein FtsQ/DivIB [Rhodobacteraceae bacterium MCCB 386]|nr:cell division protein FtsQ/DivIB [Roseitranquillus sediminis]
MQRLLLTPLFWRALLWGLPLALVLGGTGLWLSDADRRQALVEGATELRRQIEERPEFMVQIMAVEGASDPLAAEIREILHLRLPVSSFDLDLQEVRDLVAALDPVAGVRVAVRPGGVLQVDVEERVPAIVQRRSEGLVLLDATGHPVAPLAAREDRADLPLVAGTGASRAVPEALALYAAAEPIAPEMRGLVRVGERRWDVVLSGGRRILLPEAGALRALDQAIALHQAQDLLTRDVDVVDLRNPRRPTLRLGRHGTEQLLQARSDR